MLSPKRTSNADNFKKGTTMNHLGSSRLLIVLAGCLALTACNSLKRGANALAHKAG